jgi:hypothetical protein
MLVMMRSRNSSTRSKSDMPDMSGTVRKGVREASQVYTRSRPDDAVPLGVVGGPARPPSHLQRASAPHRRLRAGSLLFGYGSGYPLFLRGLFPDDEPQERA